MGGFEEFGDHAVGEAEAARHADAGCRRNNVHASDFQTTITAVTGQHVPQTTRTAAALAEVVTQKAAAETDQQWRMNKTASRELIDQANRFAQTATQNRAMQEPASMQSAEDQGNKN